jgi:hypothetical protein
MSVVSSFSELQAVCMSNSGFSLVGLVVSWNLDDIGEVTIAGLPGVAP